jgi:S1-C subfamily serine protease
MKKIILACLFFCFFFFLLFVPYAFAEGENSISRLFTQQADTIVLVGVVSPRGSNLGTGFVVGEDGLVATNYHLVEGAKRILVKLRNNHGFARVRLLSFDAQRDLALLKVDARALRVVKLGDSNRLQVGQKVVAIGNPLGLESTVSDGLISSVREVSKNVSLLQVSVPLSPGSSGGPLFNLDGEVVGVTTASFLQGQNLNFAVPVNYLKSLIWRASQIEDQARMTSEAEKPESRDFRFYRIQSGDTLYGLARRFNTTVQKITQVNHLSGSNLFIGQRLKIPVRESPGPRYNE